MFFISLIFINSAAQCVDKPYYERTYLRMNRRKGKQMSRLRGATVEPVWGTLLNFRAIKKVYTKGLDLANKQVLMAAMAYNLNLLQNCTQQKYIKLT